MKMRSTCAGVAAIAVYLAGLAAGPTPSGATSLAARDASPGKGSGASPKVAPPTKDAIVAKYVKSCLAQPAKEEECGKVRKDAVEIVKEDLRTLGSSADRTYMPTILKIFKNDEVELRIAAADAIGMIGPQDQDADALAPVTNDPVPDVRAAVGQAISRGKGPALTLLRQRVGSGYKTGPTPEIPPDAGKFAMPVAPDSTYLFYAGDPAVGRLSYVGKTTSDPASFFKGKAKKGPFKLEEFKEKYRYQLQDEEEALNRAQDAQVKQMENVKPPDPTNAQAFMEYMGKITSVSAGRTTRMLLDSYQPELFGSPTVYVLEERQIGQRSYPTRYVVVYHEQALKKPGYRLSWMTVPDEAIKAAQVVSLKEEQQEQAMKRENEAAKKKAEELEALTKKKDETEKKQFKKGQADLEKELGF
jgi:HEAT repeat protein